MSNDIAPIWQPSAQRIAATRLTAFMKAAGKRWNRRLAGADYAHLHAWSVEHAEEFWASVWKFGEVRGEMGATVIPIGVSPDGLNINLDCGSTKPATLRETVKAQGADLGIAFDGDGDRVIMVDHQGEVLDGDELMFIIARDRLRTGSRFDAVVGTLMTNLGLEIALRALGLDLYRAKVGDRYVMERLLSEKLILGGENSGHIICLDRTSTGDGIISALQILAAMLQSGKSLHELKAGMTKYPQILINVSVTGKVDLQRAPILEAVRGVESDLGDHGRVLLRPSGTEPVIRVMVEGREAGVVERHARDLANVVRDTLSV